MFRGATADACRKQEGNIGGRRSENKEEPLLKQTQNPCLPYSRRRFFSCYGLEKEESCTGKGGIEIAVYD